MVAQLPVTCQKLKPINGTCNNEITNRCQSGTLKDIEDTSTLYQWQCVGQHGGTTASNCQNSNLLMEHVIMRSRIVVNQEHSKIYKIPTLCINGNVWGSMVAQLPIIVKN